MRGLAPRTGIIIEIDDFKWVNDTYGYRIADGSFACLIQRGRSRAPSAKAWWHGSQPGLKFVNEMAQAAFGFARTVKVEAFHNIFCKLKAPQSRRVAGIDNSLGKYGFVIVLFGFFRFDLWVGGR